MSYSVRVFRNAQKRISRLPKNDYCRVRDKLKLLKKEPFRYLEHYSKRNCYKLRIGDYRAVIDVDINNKIITVAVFDHRSKIYKR